MFKFNLLFLIIFILGLYYSKDFGVTWDEDWARVKNGKQNLAYIIKAFHLDNYITFQRIFQNQMSVMQGLRSFFDVISVIIEQIFSITDKGKIF